MSDMPEIIYDTQEQLVDAFTRRFMEVDGNPDDWKGMTFRTDEGDQTLIVRPYTGAAGRGRWHVELFTALDDHEVTGTGELTPPRLQAAIAGMCRHDAQLARVDHERELEKLREKAAAIAQAQADLRWHAVSAVRDNGILKVAVAEAAGTTRPTLDAWLAAADRARQTGRPEGPSIFHE